MGSLAQDFLPPASTLGTRAKGVAVELGTCEKLKEAMTISGNHNLDLQLVIIAFDTWDSVWINPV